MSVQPGTRVWVRGHDPHLALHVAAWCRDRGHLSASSGRGVSITCGTAEHERWQHAERLEDNRARRLADHADPHWGLAGRGALIERGGPALGADLVDRDHVWADSAPKLYAQALASQWDPALAIDWSATQNHHDDLEQAVTQIMTYLIENELAMRIVPSRHISRIHPYYREILQLLAIQAADEARHVEVFTRRAHLHRTSSVPRRWADAARRRAFLMSTTQPSTRFLLSVLGEGSFLNLLAFIERHAPEPQ